MAIELNHTIVPARDPKASARFLAGILGIEVGAPVSHFTPVTLDNQVTLDYDHADPACRQAGQVYTSKSGNRGTYFRDPDGHLMEILTAIGGAPS